MNYDNVIVNNATLNNATLSNLTLNNATVNKATVNTMPINKTSTNPNDAAINKALIDSIPMVVVAQVGEVTVYQTFAEQVPEVAVRYSRDTHSLNTDQIGQASYGKLNLGLHVHDNPQQVLFNRMQLLSAINHSLDMQPLAPLNQKQRQPSIKSLYWVNQVHGHQVYDVDVTAAGMCPPNADAMISQRPATGLAIMTADCVPIVLYQPETGRIAAIHAGWQGLACGVIKATVERFSDEPIMAWIGACISQANYEVGTEVAEQLLAGCVAHQLLATADIDSFESLFCIVADVDTDTDIGKTAVTEATNIDNFNNADKLKLDLPKIAMAQLETLGVTMANESPIDCSYADSRYYSYRRQTHKRQPATGRMALIIVRSVPIKN